ncbi:phosphatase PAP2 family protein [Flavobacterium sp. GT3R68]|uniref:phosphatase PAP2 family protein n=1 Tax=Flavobacterium sp. GT3R68 TaxID=2594437 RepID=UPI000F884151|nr:phosphatase PAP2 family protein [Flavobacterium sp. GT3R68]RTY90891.1 phosphatase PAP2 family protein [Flavobacterium sp. GSN2]TRW90454.1 phosphatase PAP2 family protein [Flavobacterium sp. GT3R68]
MLEKLLDLDRQLFMLLNGWGSETYDGLWLFITKQINWIPFFILLAYLIIKKLGAKQSLILIIFVALLIAVTDQSTNFVKNSFHRLRPSSNPDINLLIRAVQKRNSFSFFSGHAANTMAVATMLFLLMKPYYKYFWFIFFWPLIFAYSRIYLGLHYPSDILCGYLFGLLTGSLMFIGYQTAQKKYFPAKIEEL